jgi:hypothetical protein
MSIPSGFGKDIPWERGSKNQEAASEQPPAPPPPTTASVPPSSRDSILEGGGIDLRIVFGVSFAVIVLAVSLLLFYSSIARTRASDQTPAGASMPTPAQAAQQPQPETPTPSCVSGAAYLDTIGLLEQAGRREAAANTAEAALKRRGLCKEDSAALAEKAISNGLHALFAQKVAGLNVAAQQQVVRRYDNLKQQAAAAGVPFPMSQLEVAQQARAHGHFLLAKTVFERAYVAGEFTKADQTPLLQYIETLQRLGWWWSRGTGETKEAGLRLLVTSHTLDVENNTAPGLAWAELRNHCDVAAGNCPPPAETPLIDTPHGGS